MSFYSDRIFPVVNDLLTKFFVRHRKKVLSSATGNILEIGFGSGISLPCYPSTVSKIVGLEPNTGMLRKARVIQNELNGRKLPFSVEIVKGRAEQLPFSADTFDGVVSFLTLCSVANLSKTIEEIGRVLKPGGKIFFIEHVIQPPQTITRRIQIIIQPLWQHIACGCHVDRDTLGAIQSAGFRLDVNAVGYCGFPNFLGPIYRGTCSRE